MFGLFGKHKKTKANEAMKTYCQHHDIAQFDIENDPDAPVFALPESIEKTCLCCVFIRFKRMAKTKKGAAFQSSRHGASAGQDMLEALSALQRTLNNNAYQRKALNTQILSHMEAFMQQYDADVYDENGFGYGTLVSVKREFTALINNEVAQP